MCQVSQSAHRKMRDGTQALGSYDGLIHFPGRVSLERQSQCSAEAQVDGVTALLASISPDCSCVQSVQLGGQCPSVRGP